MKQAISTRRFRALKAAILGTAAIAAGSSPALAGQTGNLVTISLSGSTAMRAFTTSPGFSFLTPGTSITLNAGVNGAPVTFTAPNSPTTQAQLAPGAFPAGFGEVNGLRIEWHEHGSVEGILELANDQAGLISGLPSRNPSGTNPVWVNRNRFTAAGSANEFQIGNFGQVQGQSPVQMAISDVNARQGFAITGTGRFNATPGSEGYGQGNGRLINSTLSGLGEIGARQQLQPATVLNLPAGANGVGPWNNGGVDNTDNKQVAVTATLVVANPGTGLTKINRSNAQWLQSTGRLSNGADFNVAQRDVNSGTRNVLAANTGLDPSWAVGENDGGDNTTAVQNTIGGGIRFSGKTAGSAVRTTVQNARMGVGPLGMSDSIGFVKTNTQSTTPLRALDYADSDTDGTFVRASASSITDGSYVIWQNQTYVTIKAPNAAFAGDTAAQWRARTDAQTGIKGDNSGDDVADVRNNILGSVFNFPAQASVANPADQLLANSFILPRMQWKGKDIDGINTATAKTANLATSGNGYDASLRNALLNSSLAANFAVGDPSAIRTGSTGARYNGASAGTTSGDILITDNGSGGGNWLFGNFNQDGRRDYASVISAVDAQAKLAASGAGVDANAGSGNSTFILNVSPTLAAMNGGAGATKGDLIVMGDYNADGKFDGKDLYNLARGASLADTNTSDHLTTASGVTLGDQLRGGVLRKNAAMDYLNTNATAQQRIDASANTANDPSGDLAFQKADVNRDGLLNLKDAKLVDYYVTADYRVLDHQLDAVQGADGDSPQYTQSTTFKPLNLVDVELNDTGNIDTFDFRPVRLALGTALKDGDLDFNGVVNFDDYARIDSGFNSQNNKDFVTRWSSGDIDSNDHINFDDYALIDAAFNNQGGSAARAIMYLNGKSIDRMDTPELAMVASHSEQFGQAYAIGFLAAVPEPGSVGVLGLAALSVLSRRRRAREGQAGC